MNKQIYGLIQLWHSKVTLVQFLRYIYAYICMSCSNVFAVLIRENNLI